MPEGTVLLVEDDRLERLALEAELRDDGYTVLVADNAVDGLELFRRQASAIDLVVTDLRMPGQDGMTLLRQIKLEAPDAQVILLTAYGSVESAVGAMQAGATDYLSKPFRYEELSFKLQRLLETRAHLRELAVLRHALDGQHRFHELVGRSPAMRRVFDTLETIASDPCSVLVQGRTGTGKELVARALHHSGPRADGPFVALHCAALSRELIESELFGHEQGAFPGALRQHRGRFELADGGTLFLDEVDEIPLDIQVKLLRVIEQRRFERVGGELSLELDVRLVSATKTDLAARVREGRFREDLYYRLRGATVVLPDLAERREDIPLLAEHVLRRTCQARGLPPKRFAPDALRALVLYAWPGNVRQLETAVEQAVLLSRGELVELSALPPELREADASAEIVQLHLDGHTRVDLPCLLQQVEDALVRWALAKAAGNQGKAAEMLGIPRTTLRHRLR